jgi:hypothetical protein
MDWRKPKSIFSALFIKVFTIVYLGFMKKLLAVFSIQLLFASSAWALPPGTVKLTSTKLFQVSTEDGKFVCGKISNKWVPGAYVNKKAKLFQPLSAKIKQIQKQMAKADPSQHESMQLQLNTVQSKLTLGKPHCKKGKPTSGGGSGGGGSTPTPTPTPPSSGTNCFDSSGSATSAGKAKFGIPSSLGANITSGRYAVQSMCSGCHADELGRTFSNLRSAIAADPMFYTNQDVPDSVLANITAYLNRFRSSCN